MSLAAPENLLTAWSQLLFDSLAAAGVTRVVASPGSRSTPFVLAAAAHPRLTVLDVIDERSAAFFALGQARASGMPSVLLCTSGSAAAHYLPAVIEANESGVPLLIVTADRPAELLHVSANQTIDHRLLFEGYVRMVVDVGAPDAAPSALRGLRRLAAHAVALAQAPHPGVVHLNLRARKPLERAVATSPAALALDAQVRELMSRPIPLVAEGHLTPEDDAVTALARRCVEARRGLIVAGPAPAGQAGAREAVRALVEQTGFPLVAEAASQLRFAGAAQAAAPLIDTADWLFRLPAADGEWRPDLILQLGAPLTSGAWERWLDRHPDIERIVITPHGWQDPQNSASWIVHAEVGATCAALARAVARLRVERPPSSTEFSRALAAANAQVHAVLDSHSLGRDDALGEAAVARTVAEALPEGGWLVLGNSLPIRTVDAWCAGPLRDVRVLSQRGASGIDGLISGAAGTASVVDDPVILLVGDVSALHDIGGVALGKFARAPLVVVVVNNGGGRIFEQLPVAASASEDLLRHFTTPHAVDFNDVAALYGHAYQPVATRSALHTALRAALTRSRCTLIDAHVPPHDAAETQARVLATLATTRFDA